MNPDSTELLHEGNRAVARRDYQAAAEAFRSLIGAEPNAADGYVGLAKVLWRQRDHRGVVDLLEPVHQRFPAPRVLRQLGDAYRALAYEPRAPRSLADRAIWFYEALRQHKKDAVSLFYLAEVLRELKHDYGRALSAYRESWSVAPGSPSVLAGAVACAAHLADAASESVVAEMRGWKRG